MINKLTYNGSTYDSQITANAARLIMRHGMVGEELAIDELQIPITLGNPIRVICSDQGAGDFILTSDGYIVCTSDGVVPEFLPNTPGQYYFNDTLVSKQYLQELRRTGLNDWLMYFNSAIKLLDNSDHVGGLYTGQTVGTILPDIMGDIAYTVDDDVAAVQIYSWLPYDKRRNNLQKLLMAGGAHIRNAADGTLRITTLTSTPTGTFDESRVFIGGSITSNNPATAVQVIEHNFLESEDETTLYENSTVSEETITFNEPIHDLVITNGTIISSGVNYCTFLGAGAVTITGKTYVHVQRVVTHGIGSNVKKVQDNTLISPNNAPAVAERLYNFLSVAKTIKQEVVFGTERPGDVVNVLHPYTRESVSATVKNMDIELGQTESRANTEFLVGYEPSGIIPGFEHYAVLTGTGTWEVPEGVTTIRVIAADPGLQGETGKIGESGSTYAGGVGGDAGLGGAGGKIFEINLTVTPGTTKSYSCGEHTIFDGLSAELGRSYPYGYYEPKSVLTIGAKGANGLDGGAGSGSAGTGPSITKGATTYNAGANGFSDSLGGVTAYGGYGGGAASAGNGGSGGNGTVTQSGGYYLTFSAYAGSSTSPVTGKPGYTYATGSNYIYASGAFDVTLTTTSSPIGHGNVYIGSGTSITHYRNHDNIGNLLGYIQSRTISVTGSPLAYTQRGGSGGNGAAGGTGADATNYGAGGTGGDGGGGGGQSRGYTDGYPGAGGAGGLGGAGGDGVIIVYY